MKLDRVKFSLYMMHTNMDCPCLADAIFYCQHFLGMNACYISRQNTTAKHQSDGKNDTINSEDNYNFIFAFIVLHIVHGRNNTARIAPCYTLALLGIHSARGRIFRAHDSKP